MRLGEWAFPSTPVDLTCTFTDTSTDDGPLSWSWAFGDGGSSTAQNPVHIYESAGTYTVTLTVNDGEFSDQASNDQVTATEPEVIDVQLAGDAEISRNKWTAIVEDLNGNVLDGTWSESGTASCSGSVCTLSNLNARKVSTVTFTETITGNGESIVIARP